MLLMVELKIYFKMTKSRGLLLIRRPATGDLIADSNKKDLPIMAPNDLSYPHTSDDRLVFFFDMQSPCFSS